MSEKDQVKLLKAGFTLFRETSGSTLLARFPELDGWVRIESFPAPNEEEHKAHLDSLLKDQKNILL